MTTRVPETATAAPADDNSTSPSLPWLLERRQWTQALHVARARVSSDPWDIAAWWGLARALMEGLMEPEAAYTACCRALQALENRPQPSQPPQPPGRYGRRVDMPSPQQLAELRFECLSAVARGDSNSVRARWNRHLHPALRLQRSREADVSEDVGGLCRTAVCSSNGSRSSLQSDGGGSGGGGGDSSKARIAGPEGDGRVAAAATCRGATSEAGAAAATAVGPDTAARVPSPLPPPPPPPPPRRRIFVLSDLHADVAVASHGPLVHNVTQMDLLRRISATRFRDDVLLVAGDAADTLPAAREALRVLKERFGRVFYVPGNHCLWLRPKLEDNAFPDSFSKLWALLAACDELGVETVAAEVIPGLLVVPLFSWYNAAFDIADPRPGRYRFDCWCRWPVSDLDVWQVMLRLNDTTLAAVSRWQQQQRQQHHHHQPHQPPSRHQSAETASCIITPAKAKTPDPKLCSGSASNGSSKNHVDLAVTTTAGHSAGLGGVVVTMTHFLPHPDLPFSPLPRDLAKAVGCREILTVLERIGSDVHVYGHSHVPYDGELPAVEGCDGSPGAIQAHARSGRVVNGNPLRRGVGGDSGMEAVEAVGGKGREGVRGKDARGECSRRDWKPARMQGAGRRFVHWPLHGQGDRLVIKCIWDGDTFCNVETDAIIDQK